MIAQIIRYFTKAERRRRALERYYGSEAYKAWERAQDAKWATYDRNNARMRQYSTASTRMPRDVPPPPMPRACL